MSFPCQRKVPEIDLFWDRPTMMLICALKPKLLELCGGWSWFQSRRTAIFLSTESRIFQHLKDATELVHSNYDKAMVFWFQKQWKHVWGSDLFRNTCGCFLFRQRDCCFFISTPRIVVSSPSWSRRIPYLGWVPSTKNWCSHRKLFLMYFLEWKWCCWSHCPRNMV